MCVLLAYQTVHGDSDRDKVDDGDVQLAIVDRVTVHKAKAKGKNDASCCGCGEQRKNKQHFIITQRGRWAVGEREAYLVRVWRNLHVFAVEALVLEYNLSIPIRVMICEMRRCEHGAKIQKQQIELCLG